MVLPNMSEVLGSNTHLTGSLTGMESGKNTLIDILDLFNYMYLYIHFLYWYVKSTWIEDQM